MTIEISNISNNDNLILLIIDITSNDQTKKTLYEFYHSSGSNNLVKINSTDICKDILKNDIIENCSEYSIESIIKNSCIKCKNDYYPIYNDSINNDNLMKCYKNLEGYYFDNNYKLFKQCFKTCKTCYKSGNSFFHNCISCKYEYQYLFLINCYNHRPVNSSKPKEKDNIYEIKCSSDKPFENLENHQCIAKCEINQRFNNECKLNFISEEAKKENLKAKVIEDIQKGELGEVLNQVLKSNETYSFQNGDEKHSISTLSGSDSNLKKAGVTSINFGSNCQQILKGNNDNQEIILYDVEHHIEGFNTPIIEYALFDEVGQKLNLDECNDDRVIYYIPNNINEGDLDKHDPSSDFYNNCNKETAKEGIDMTSYDKSLYFNDNNMSLCQKGCIMKGLHPETKKTICDCSISSNIEFNDANQADFLDKMESDKSTSNFGVTNCFGDVFSSPKKLITNSGFIILTIILGIYIIIFIIFCSKGKKKKKKKRKKERKKGEKEKN